MSIAQDARFGNLTTVLPTVYVGAVGATRATTALSAAARNLMEWVVVDGHLHLPDMVEIVFADQAADVLAGGGIALGVPLEVWAGSPESPAARQLIAAEVTAVEGRYDTMRNHTVVRGYTRDHRMQRFRRNRTFLNMKDSDIAREVATGAGLTVGRIEETSVTHDHVGQVNQTDWQFLSWRAGRIGYETGVSGGALYFRRASGTATATGPAVDLTFPINLRSFAPRLTAGNLAPAAEVRVWDPLAATVVSASEPTATGTAALTPALSSVTALFTPKPVPAPPPPGNPALGDLGPAPSNTAHVLADQPLATGSATGAAADEALAGLREHQGSSYAEAEGEAIGDPAIAAGSVVSVTGVPDPFSGDWVVTTARHVFGDGRYRTRFEVSGRHTRTLLGLTGGVSPAPAPINGVVCGIVSNINDPLAKARVKVTLPWLSPRFESDWGSVVQFGAGRRSGAMFLPEVGDEVLVAFEFGDPRRPYVLGGVVNNATAYTVGGAPVRSEGEIADVAWRGFTSASGNRLAFHDQVPPGEGEPPSASDLVLGTGDGSLALTIDQVAGTVSLQCQPEPPGSKAEAGTLTIRCGVAGIVNIVTGEGGTVTVDGGSTLNLKAQELIKIASEGPVEITGNPIKLN